MRQSFKSAMRDAKALSDRIDSQEKVSEPIATGACVVGRLLCGTVRDFLERVKFSGADIEWHESKGLLEREFTIRCPLSTMRAVMKTLKTLEDGNPVSQPR